MIRFSKGFVLGAACALYVVIIITGYDIKSWNFSFDIVISILVFFVATIAALANYRSSQTAELEVEAARVQAQAALLPERLAIYEVVKNFLGPWLREGHADLSMLPSLVQAWEKSHFLFDDDVVRFLRQLWLDGVASDMYRKVISEQMQGDRKSAIDKEHALLMKYFGNETGEHAAHIAAFKAMRLDHRGSRW